MNDEEPDLQTASEHVEHRFSFHTRFGTYILQGICMRPADTVLGLITKDLGTNYEIDGETNVVEIEAQHPITGEIKYKFVRFAPVNPETEAEVLRIYRKRQ